MRLIELSLTNFRQHADTRIDFEHGVTAIVGPTGSGKSTLLEAIAWVIYGTRAARGTRETLRYVHAPERSRVGVELAFEHGGRRYRVVRTLHDANVYVDGSEKPAAASAGGVSEYLERVLGMDQDEFFNTYFTNQKQLEFLGAMGSTERGRFLSEVLGYDKLRRAQELLRERRSQVRREVELVLRDLPDLDAVRAERLAAERRVERLGRDIEALAAQLDEVTDALEAARPRAERMDEAARSHARLERDLETARRDRDEAERERSRLEAELEKILEGEEEREKLQARVAGLDEAREQARQMEAARSQVREAERLDESIREAEAELEAGRERYEQVAQAPAVRDMLRARQAEVGVERTVLVGEIQEREARWQAERREAAARAGEHRSRARDLTEHLASVEESGPEGACVVCERELGPEYENVHESLHAQLERARQEAARWEAREKELARRPAELARMDEKRETLDAERTKTERKLARAEAAIEELAALDRERGARRERLEVLRQKRAGLTAEYDEERHRALRQRIDELARHASRLEWLEEALSKKDLLERERARASETRQVAGKRKDEVRAAILELGYSEEAHGEARSTLGELEERRRKLEVRRSELQGEERLASEQVTRATQKEHDTRGRHAELGELETEVLHLDEVDLAFSELRTELNEQIRPELAETASEFLTELSGGRYGALLVTDAYEVRVLDGGEEKPVISGGEEDMVNLSLRLALSQMIADRAGQPLSLLVLDEVFGSLDALRRASVTDLLQRLGDRFEQILVVTHVEDVRERVDQVVQVDYDEVEQASIVDASPATGREMVLPPGVVRGDELESEDDIAA